MIINSSRIKRTGIRLALVFASLVANQTLSAADTVPTSASPGDSSFVSLRGYGRVSASFAAGRAEFACQSPEKAELLHGKLLADLLWDVEAEKRSGKAIEIEGIKAIVYEVPSRGAIVVGRLEGKVVALGGADAKEAANLAAKEPMFRDGSCRFKADKAYPIYLDFFDLGAMKVYTYAMQSARGEGFASHWLFNRNFGLSGIGYHLGGGMVAAKSPAPGILNFVDTDFEVREAERNHGMILPGISPGGALPIWAYNQFPQSIMRLSPTGIGEDEHMLRLIESYGTTRPEREITGLWSLRETMRRYQASPAVGGWQILNGPAGIEVLHSYQQCGDFSETGLKSYREYLKTVKGFDLKTVGLRYFNDPGHFKSWDEVMPLDANAFYGNLDDSCLLLKNWHWQLADSKASEPPTRADSKWREVMFPGGDEMHTIPEADAFYQTRFDAKDWIKKNSGKELHLICARTRDRNPAPIKVWLNGKFLGEQKRLDTVGKSRPVAVKVNGVLESGPNELKLMIPKGKMLSPLFLTGHKPEEYPSSDKTLNARFADLKDWHYDSLGIKQRDAFELARGIDPDRSFILPAGGGWEMSEDLSDIARDMGSSIQNTGREAFYQPWWARLGRIAGFYGTSEPSATTPADPAKPGSLNRLFGWILIDGDASHTLYWQLEDYIGIERETGWFSKNKRLMSLVGKSMPLPPQIAILRSTKTMRYSPEHYAGAPWVWDVGRGELNDAHYNWGYVTERELRRGLPKTCKVVFDAGSEVMEQPTVDAIASFVSEGGTYVALHNTGRHDPIEANSWPISRLTGCKVVGEKANGKIRFQSGISIFKDWDGREFEADGIAITWQGADYSKGQSVRLSPQSGDVQVLAKWADGTAAVTSRTLGKGRVIWLGSTFWRNARDKDGAWISREGKLAILEKLFTDLGVQHTADASLPDIWVGDNITKNGLENWLVAFNTVRDSRTADIRFRADARPSEVRELTTGQTVPFGYVDGSVQLKGVAFSNTQTKVFAIKRANLADGLPFWWAEKTTYWKKSNVPAIQDEPLDPVRLGAIKIESWKFLADRDGGVSLQNNWATAQFHDSAWETMETGPWNSLKEELKDYTGIGLYRTSFAVPAEWKSDSVSLNVYGDRLPKIFGSAEFFINGKKVEGAPFQKDMGAVGYPSRIVISNLLTSGRNVLGVKIKGGAKFGGEDFSGLGGTVYLAVEKPLSPALELGGKWTAVRLDGSSTQVVFPVSKAMGKFIARDFAIPASWTGRKIYLRLETETPWVEAIRVNGKLLLSAQFRRVGRYIEWNVTPWVEPGKDARVEMWTRALPMYNPVDPAKPATDGSMDLLSAKIGCIK